MAESEVVSGTAHFPPGTAAPKVGDRIAALRDPARMAKLNEGKAAWYALPKEERQRITAERKAAKQARQAQRAAKHRGNTEPPETTSDDAPATVRSVRERTTLISAPPESEMPRPGVRGGPLRGLLDLCEAMPKLGDGTCFIQVTRTKPVMAFGVPCAGAQKPLWEPVDDAEFAVIYGGAEYSLRGYALREGARAKALTEVVTYKVAGAPNLDSALTEEDAMRPQHVPNGATPGLSALRRPSAANPHVASAEAEMYDRRLSHEETMDERKARREEERRQRLEQSERAERQQQAEALRLLNERTEREAMRTREIYEERLAEKEGRTTEMIELMKALKPDGDQSRELVRQHSAEIKQLTEAHREQLQHLTESHQAEMRRLTDAHAAAVQRLDDMLRAERDRSDKLIRESDLRASEQIREAERRADQRVVDAQNTARTTYEDLKTRSEERLRDQAQAFQQRIEDMRDNHARELKRKDDELVLMRTGLEGNQGIVLSNKDAEIKRLERELREAKELAESNKDWLGQMKKAEEQAEMLGYSKPEPGEGGESEDLKIVAAKAGLNMLTQLPQIIESGANAVRSLRNPAAPPDLAHGQARAGVRAPGRLPRALGAPPPVMMAPLPFATEEGGYTPPTDAAPPAPLPRQTIAPLQQSSTHSVLPPQEFQQQVAAPQQPEQQSASPQLPAPAPTPAPQHPTAPQQEQMVPAPPSMPPPPAGATDLDPVVISVIQNLTPDLAQAFAQHVPPQALVERIIEANGIDGVRTALTMINIDQLIGAVSLDQRPEHASLKTRNGVKFLREIWATAEKMVSA